MVLLPAAFFPDPFPPCGQGPVRVPGGVAFVLSRALRPGLRAWWIAVWMLLCSGVPASELTGLYRAEVPVSSRDESARPEGFRQGLQIVLGRVVRAEDLNSAAVRSVLAKPERYVLEFEYPGTYRDGKPILSVEFDADEIRQWLHRGGVEIWGSERPEILAWILLEDGQPGRIVFPGAVPGLDRLLRELADAAGLSVTLPLGDLDDEQNLNAGDIVAGDAERIRGASARYEMGTILAGRLGRSPRGDFEGEWRLYRGDREDRWQTRSGDVRGALSSGLAGVYARLAGQLVPSTGSTATVELRIIDIVSLDDSNKVASYLVKLSPVTKLEWLSLGSGEVSFRLAVRGGRQTLEETLAAGKLLRPADEPDPSRLTYRLMP